MPPMDKKAPHASGEREEPQSMGDATPNERDPAESRTEPLVGLGNTQTTHEPQYTLATAAESEIAAAVRESLGVGPTEEVGVNIRGRGADSSDDDGEGGEYDKEDADSVSPPPQSREEWEELAELDPDTLTSSGMRLWSEDSSLYLFPMEWYDDIPEGLEITTISGETKPFDRTEDHKEQRFGVLPYGVKLSSADSSDEEEEEEDDSATEDDTRIRRVSES